MGSDIHKAMLAAWGNRAALELIRIIQKEGNGISDHATDMKDLSDILFLLPRDSVTLYDVQEKMDEYYLKFENAEILQCSPQNLAMFEVQWHIL